MHVVTIDLPELGNRCHLVHDGSQALVIDPPRDLSVVERAAAEAEVDIAAVADTHLHNDYVSGALGLARRHGADYLLSADESVDFERVGVRDGDVVGVGGLDVRVIATPGHTRHHQSFLTLPRGTADPHPGALFSGGSLLQGTVGRTDLLGDLLTRDLARAQWASARTLGALDVETRLHPTHGFGSFCASGPVESGDADDDDDATIGQQRAVNPALLVDQEPFVEELVAGFGPVPAYYEHMGPLNRAGAGRRLPLPAQPLTADEVQTAMADGAWVVDLRGRGPFAEAHLAGTVSIEYSSQFATYVGWLAPWYGQLVVLTDRPADLAPALRDLAGIGIDGIGTHVLDPARRLPATYRRTDWTGFHAGDPGRVVVDVRERDEFVAGHLPGAVHLPVHEVERRLSTLPPGELWVHCRSGYRAGIAASLLHRAGRAVVHVDDDWARLDELAIPTTRNGLAA